MKDLRIAILSPWSVVAMYALVAVFILLPLLWPGYILTLDMVFTPRIPMPDAVTSSYLFHALLHVLNTVIPSQIIEKLLLFGILLLSGVGMHRLVRYVLASEAKSHTMVAGYVAGLFYTINPYTYSRFMAGQYSVLLGYACLPFFVEALLRFAQAPSWRRTIVLSAWVVGISIVSIHTLGLMLLVAVIAIGQALWRTRGDMATVRRLLQYSAAACLIVAAASAYWLVPLLHGSGQTATAIDTFQATNQSAFATAGSGAVGKLVHVLRLQGFWGERQNLYLLPQDSFLGIWWAVFVVAIWATVIVGVRVAWRQRREIAHLLVWCIAIAAILAAGIGTGWLANHVPLFAGYREPQKFAAVVALGYAVFIGFALSRAYELLRSRTQQASTAALALAVLCGFTPVMFGGFDGQLVPRQYPADWYRLNQKLDQDHSNFHVLFLPWHLYMRYQFAGRIIANPAQTFFNKPTFVSDDPEFGNAAPAIPNAQLTLLGTNILPQARNTTTLGRQLAPFGVKYIVLTKDFDYRSYNYLGRQTDLQLVTDAATLKVYRNTAFGKE